MIPVSSGPDGPVGQRRENGFKQNTDETLDFTRVKVAWVHLKQINPPSKIFQNHRTVINRKKAYFHQKAPTPMSATYKIMNFCQNFYSRIPRESRKIFLQVKKISFSEFSLHIKYLLNSVGVYDLYYII